MKAVNRFMQLLNLRLQILDCQNGKEKKIIIKRMLE
jgi:uncharacterized protein YlxP (DUF503 family)